MNEQEVISIIKRIKVTWSNYKLDDDTDLLIEVYLDWLGDYSAEEVQAAIKTFKGARFAPGPAEILAVLEPDQSSLGEPWMVRSPSDVNFFSPGTANAPEGH